MPYGQEKAMTKKVTSVYVKNLKMTCSMMNIRRIISSRYIRK